ncbi:MAG: glycerol-3-phosphate acyltransferase [Chloroflexi bacterium]|nr:glycerol-3-phosphate acyltransferase [Chloroflexota bacterium]
MSRVIGAPDPREVGTGNAGATNLALHAGVGAGLVVFLIDLAKGLVAVTAGAGWDGPAAATSAGIGAVVGQIAPVFTGFRGGKGVATTLGGYIGIAPLVAAAAIGLWAVNAFVVVRRFIIATVVTMVTLAVVLAVMQPPAWLRVYAAATAIVTIWAHRRDLRAWRAGQMPTVGQALRDNPLKNR